MLVLGDGAVSDLRLPPDKLPKESRYFHYVHIARLLGATGEKKRAKLPKCVQKRIASMFPDTEGAATKVGYQEAE